MQLFSVFTLVYDTVISKFCTLYEIQEWQSVEYFAAKT